MHPWDHARSSRAIHGGAEADYLPLHDWFDLSKSQLAFFTHRALRHHREGVACALRRFGPTIRNEEGREVSTETLGLQHLDEDCRRIPSAADWLSHLRAPDWLPAVIPSAEAIAETEARRLGADPADLLPLSAWMLETAAWFGDARHLAMRHHAFGIFEAEAVFGATLPTSSGRRIPTRYVAERHVRRVLGRIPAAADWLRRIEGQRWMAEARHPSAVLPPRG